ncbi:MAG: DUF3488 domain-containing protein [Planctomycetes bacterium]|nr:DUF3488 domain-containing protein [Planctomycetota bacterium]
MSLSNAFRVSLYSLVALAAGMLAYGEDALFPSGVTIGISMFILASGGRLSWLRINALVGNLLGLAAMGAAAVEFFGDRFESRLLAGSHFLVYITWVVLLQAKGIRQYWWLSALSLLQVALGAVLTNQSGPYGMLLLIYLLLALWTLSVFTMYQGAFDLGGLDRDGATVSDPVATSGVQLEFAAPQPTDSGGAEPVRTIHRFFSSELSSSVRHAIQQDTPGRWIFPRFVIGVMGLSIAGLALGLLVFLFVPRVSFATGRFRTAASTRGKSLSGFSGEVRLGQVGQILENIDRVMRVRLFKRINRDNVEPMSLEQFAAEFGLKEPLFRGAVLDTYRSGRWRRTEREEPRPKEMEINPLESNLIRQEYSLELPGSEYLFAMRPLSLARLYNPPGPVFFFDETGVLNGTSERRDPLEYLVYSRRRSFDEKVHGRNVFGALPGYRSVPRFGTDAYLKLPEQGLEGTIALANELTNVNRLPEANALSLNRRKAQALETYLAESGGYLYSLNMSVENPEADPIEEFVTSRKRGHCEYFASALAVMLRAVNIPSRLVIGFKGADFHPGETPEDAYYEVQQRHAHAWVEAFVDGEWMVFDPTPAAREESVRNVAATAGFWKNAKNSISDLWSTYVVSLSFDRQQNSLYGPVSGAAKTLRSFFERLKDGVIRIQDFLAAPQMYVNRKGIGVTVVCLVVVLFLARLAWRGLRQASGTAYSGPFSVVRWGFQWMFARITGRTLAPAQVIVAFYQQFQDLMHVLGLNRRDDQTQREFAQDVERFLEDRLVQAELRGFPSQLCDLFYRVRFGGEVLQAGDAADVQARLTRLASLVNQSGVSKRLGAGI